MNIDDLYLQKRPSKKDIIVSKKAILIQLSKIFASPPPIEYLKFLILDDIMTEFKDEDYSYVKRLVWSIVK